MASERNRGKTTQRKAREIDTNTRKYIRNTLKMCEEKTYSKIELTISNNIPTLVNKK